MSTILERYNKLSKLPAGHFIFSKLVGFAAPFFGKIRPNVISLKPAYCEVSIKDRWGIRNHIGTINAGALCSLAEMTGGLALDTVVPPSMRWIPRGMTVKYVVKATGVITAISEFEAGIVKEGNTTIPITVRNDIGETVFTADIEFYLSQKPNRQKSGF